MAIAALLLSAMFLAVSTIGFMDEVVSNPDITVLAQIGQCVFGDSSDLFWNPQISTLLIQVLEVNTAFSGFSPLAEMLAEDNCLPMQMKLLGDRVTLSTVSRRCPTIKMRFLNRAFFYPQKFRQKREGCCPEAAWIDYVQTLWLIHAISSSARMTTLCQKIELRRSLLSRGTMPDFWLCPLQSVPCPR